MSELMAPPLFQYFLYNIFYFLSLVASMPSIIPYGWASLFLCDCGKNISLFIPGALTTLSLRYLKLIDIYAYYLTCNNLVVQSPLDLPTECNEWV